MKKLLSLGILCASLTAAPLVANAATLDGSDSIAFFNVSTTPSSTPLDPATGITQISWTLGLTSSVGLGDFSVIPGTTNVSATTLYTQGLNGGDGTTPFTISIGTYGTFTETANPVLVAQSLNGLNSSATYYLLGTFTPSGTFSEYDANNASLILSFTNSNGSLSGGGTFATPAVPLTTVPEPSSLILLGTGLVGAVGTMRRRFIA